MFLITTKEKQNVQKIQKQCSLLYLISDYNSPKPYFAFHGNATLSQLNTQQLQWQSVSIHVAAYLVHICSYLYVEKKHPELPGVTCDCWGPRFLQTAAPGTRESWPCTLPLHLKPSFTRQGYPYTSKPASFPLLIFRSRINTLSLNVSC